MQVQRGEVQVEEVEKDLGAMTTEQQRAAVMADAPELAALLADLQSSLAEVRSRIGPLLKQVRITLLLRTRSPLCTPPAAVASILSLCQDSSLFTSCPEPTFPHNCAESPESVRSA